MNRMNYYMLAATALWLAFACQNEELEWPVSEDTVESVNVLQARVVDEAIQGRAQVELGAQDPAREIFMWNEKDAFSVFNQAEIDETAASDSLKAVTFTLSNYDSEYPSKAYDFVGDGSVPVNAKVSAIYPVCQEADIHQEGVITLTLPTATEAALGSNSPEDLQKYLSSHMFMAATATVAQPKTELNFQQLASMARVTYTNGTNTDQTITRLEMMGDAAYFATATDYHLLNGSATATQKAAAMAQTFEGLTVPSGYTVDFYLLFFPGSDFAADGKLTFRLTDGSLQVSEVSILTEKVLTANPNAKGFEAGKRYRFNILQTNSRLIWKKDVEEGVITNLLLLQALERDNKPVKFNRDEDGFVRVSENKQAIENIHHLYQTDAFSLDGIEHFTALTNMDCKYSYNFSMRELDLSHNVNLVELRIRECPSLTSLKINGCTLLEELECALCSLTSLDVSASTKLKTLDCSQNNLVSLDVSKNVNLVSLNVNENNISTLHLGTNKKLETLKCFSNSLSELNLQLPELNTLYCGGNQLSSLNLSECSKLSVLNMSSNENNSYGEWNLSNPIAELNLSNNPQLKYLEVSKCNNLKNLNISNNVELEYLGCGCSQLTSIDLSKAAKLKEFYCWGRNKISELDFSHNVELKNVSLAFSDLTSLDFTYNINLESLDCGRNQLLKSLSIENNMNLKYLNCYETSLSSLNLSNNVKLKELNCAMCIMSELDVTTIIGLERLVCGNQMTPDSHPINLILWVTDTQKKWWDENELTQSIANQRVTAQVKE